MVISILFSLWDLHIPPHSLRIGPQLPKDTGTSGPSGLLTASPEQPSRRDPTGLCPASPPRLTFLGSRTNSGPRKDMSATSHSYGHGNAHLMAGPSISTWGCSPWAGTSLFHRKVSHMHRGHRAGDKNSAFRPDPAPSLLLSIKFYWHTAVPIWLHVASGRVHDNRRVEGS